MAGHVNMMDDVLIANLSPALLRSSVRLLISQGPSIQTRFVKHVQMRLIENPIPFPESHAILNDAGGLSPQYLDYLAWNRCLLSAKLAKQSLKKSLSQIIRAMAVLKNQRPELSSELKSSLQIIDGDIVQAIQALKETRSYSDQDLEIHLLELIEELGNYKQIHNSRDADGSEYPFKRGERQVKDAFTTLFPDRAAPAARSRTKTLMSLSINTQPDFETFSLGPFQFPRLFNGLWQLSSPAWGCVSDKRQEEELIQLVQSGFTAADMADHYGDAELVYAQFRNRLSPSVRSQVLAATKWCVFAPPTELPTSTFVLEKVKERYRRLGGRVELLQFHWGDYSCKDYLNILVELVRLTAIYPNLVSTIGLCNFDSEHTVEVCEYLIAKTGSVGIVSNQVQFSLIDSRPLHLMVGVCAKYGLKLLTYGSLCGGFLSTQWLGQAAPDVYSESAMLTPSQRKYHDMIMRWGTWQDFQDLLNELSGIAEEYNVSLTNVATRWILQQPSVGAVIVGTRLGVSSHIDDNLATFSFVLNDWNLDRIDALALGLNRGKTRRLLAKLGDCGAEYRLGH